MQKLKFRKKDSKILLQWKIYQIDHISNLPCPSFNIAAVIKTLNTLLKTIPLKIELGSPLPFQATIIIALKESQSWTPSQIIEDGKD